MGAPGVLGWRLFMAVLLGLAVWLAVARPEQHFHPLVEIETGGSNGSIELLAVFDGRSTVEACEALTGKLVRVSLERCPTCRVVAARCDTRLPEAARALLGPGPVPVASGRLKDGVIAFYGPDSALAEQACTGAAQASPVSNRLTCYRSGAPRPRTASALTVNSSHALTALAALLAAWIVGWFIMRYEHLHANFTHDQVHGGPQKAHAVPTPRIGGVLVLVGLATGWIGLAVASNVPYGRELGLLLMCSLPAFLGGLVEDVTKRVGVFERLVTSMISGALGCWILGAVLHRVGLPGLDAALVWLPFAVIFTSFAVAGIANAVNIIDGFHGLAGGMGVIGAAAIAAVAFQTGDELVFACALTLAGALLGFLLWNWPGGQIFLGDGGAYLVGFLLAELSVLLTIRQPGVSPWFPALVMCHPLVETIYSIFRRKVLGRGQVSGPDFDHLHQRIYKRLSRGTADPKVNNPRVAGFVWLPSIAMAVFAAMAFFHELALLGGFVGYAVAFVAAYQWLGAGEAA